MNLRKKISLKGVLLALAISVPPLISTTVFTVQNQPLNNQTITLFDNDKTFTSLSEPYINNKNLSIVNDDLTQTVPFKVSISYIEPFKWVNYRTRSEVEAKIYDLIVLNTRQELIELNKDYEIIFVTNIAPDEVVPIQTVKVKAITDSKYLTGEFSFQIVGRLKLAKNRASYNKTIAQSPSDELFIKNVLKEEIHQEMLNQNIDESTDDVLTLLNIVPTNVKNGSDVFNRKYEGQSYYSKIVFQFSPNKIFSSDLITWNNIKMPDYEIPLIQFDYSPGLSYVDSSGDTDYPYVYEWSFKYPFWNPRPKRKEVLTSNIIFSQFDVSSGFGFQTVEEFFKVYSISLDYEYKLNTWTSNWGWAKDGGKQTDWIQKNITWTSWNGSNTKADVMTLGKDLDSGRKAYAGIKVWMDVAKMWQFPAGWVDTTFVQINADLSTAYNWNDGSWIDHAAFALLRGIEIEIIKK